MRVLITGSRDYTDYGLILRDMVELAETTGERLTIIHGACPTGADKLATGVANELGANLYTYPAMWDFYAEMGMPKAAGNIRNEEMVRETAPDVVYAYPLPQSKGTYHCIAVANAYGVPVVVR